MKYSDILNIKYPNLGVVQDIPVFVMVAIVLRFFPSCVKEQKTGPGVDGTTSVFILSVLNNIFYNNTFLLFSTLHLALVLCREGGNTEIMESSLSSFVLESSLSSLATTSSAP